MHSAAKRNSIQVIASAAGVLRALEGEPAGLSLGQIAKRVNLARSTVQRIVYALSAQHLLIAATPTSSVRLGSTLICFVSSTSIESAPATQSACGMLRT